MRTDVIHEGRETTDATPTKKVDNPLSLLPLPATALAATAIATAVIAAVATALATGAPAAHCPLAHPVAAEQQRLLIGR